MSDMVVSLYSDEFCEICDTFSTPDIIIRPGLAPEYELITDWVRTHFSSNWASEVAIALTRQPSSCLVAIKDGVLIGFACYDAIAPGFFGPTAVSVDARGNGYGKDLLIQTLQAMKARGYAYAIIGLPGPQEFYQKTVGAQPLPFKGNGIYRDMLRKKNISN